MKSPDGELYVVEGVVKELRSPERLSYTWRWLEAAPADERDTLLTIDLHDRGAATELVLTHSNFVDAASRDRHEEGWNAVLDKFATVV
jgi:glutathione S-transferase